MKCVFSHTHTHNSQNRPQCCSHECLIKYTHKAYTCPAACPAPSLALLVQCIFRQTKAGISGNSQPQFQLHFLSPPPRHSLSPPLLHSACQQTMDAFPLRVKCNKFYRFSLKLFGHGQHRRRLRCGFNEVLRLSFCGQLLVVNLLIRGKGGGRFKRGCLSLLIATATLFLCLIRKRKIESAQKLST